MLLMVSAGAMGVGLCGLVGDDAAGSRTRHRGGPQPRPDRAGGPAQRGGAQRPAARRAVARPFYAGMHDSPSGCAVGDRAAEQDAGLRRQPPIWSVERLLGVKGAALLLSGSSACSSAVASHQGPAVAAAAAAAGFFLPDLLVYNLGLKRQDELRRGLADALDMLTVCVEAGQGFDAALCRCPARSPAPWRGSSPGCCRRYRSASPGGRRSPGLTAHQRAGGEDVRDRAGAGRPPRPPIGSVLREQANQMRLVRRQRASEQAQKVTVKILFPLLLCIFPALMIVVIGPGMIR